MILGLGIDVMERNRLDRELSQGRWLPDDGIFTPEEINLCNSDPRPARCFAACFAAKEAVLKALEMTVTDLSLFREVHVTCKGARPCSIELRGRPRRESELRGVKRLSVTLACRDALVGAVVILES